MLGLIGFVLNSLEDCLYWARILEILYTLFEGKSLCNSSQTPPHR